MPEGKDPDDYIKQGGKASMLKLLKKKKSSNLLFGIII